VSMRDGRTCIRIVRKGKVAYSFDVWIGGGFGRDSSLTFYGVEGEMRSFGNASNASGHITFDPERGELVIDLLDLSLLSHAGTHSSPNHYRVGEFVDALWDRVCDALERR